MLIEIRKLIKACLIIACLVVSILGSVFIVIKPDPKHYYRGSMLKLDLLKNTPSPRIIITGGSNVAFGIDSELIEKNLHLPVINHGLVVGLGVTPIKELRDYIKPGDIVIISLEYYNFSNSASFYGYPEYVSDWIEFSPDRIKYLDHPISETPNMINIILQRKLNRQLNFYLYGQSLDEMRGLYTGDQFNSYGDFVGHLNLDPESQTEIGPSAYPLTNLEEAYTFLADFYQYTQAHGAQVFYEAQPNRQTNCEATGDERLISFYRTLHRKTSIRVLTPLDRLCIPDEYFFDTPYHLNAAGREFRTQRLIENLKNALGN
ncbi:MAG: hypothetical protein JW963_01415 [Anaerolineales bacterium]|nr:hypothetical protein [Anaerolineales bacterium]